MRFVRLRFDGPQRTWLQPEGLYCRASDAHHLQKVRISQLANDNFNSSFEVSSGERGAADRGIAR